METINSMASAAAKAVWGESNDPNTTADNTTSTTTGTGTTATNTNTSNMSANNETLGQEPVSGKLGDTSKGEPFDAGNIESGNTANNKTSTTDTSVTGTNAASADVPSTTTSSKGPTTEHPSTTGDTGFKAAQADIRDPDSSLTTDPKREAERKNVDDTGALDASENPAKVEGAGPRPVAEVARERGGDAGAVGKKVSSGSTDELGEGKKEESSESQGSGEQYVKSTGLQADGGDFDATKPGAGREADRLLEEKGIANPAAAAAAGKKDTTTADDEHDETADSKEKKSLKDKIKAKLHKN